MSTLHAVRFYFDFVSPYSWLALVGAKELGERCNIEWELQPVVYAALLDAAGLSGPAEVPVKRQYLFADAARCAARAGLPFTGPPEHPFRSLDALRTAWLFREDERGPALAAGLADACWARGLDLTDLEVLAAAVAQAGLDATDLQARISAPDVKDGLRQGTAEAIDRGVFGVPTFALDDELFWGHDRMEHLADRLAGRLPAVDVSDVLRRPRGVDRRGAPPTPERG